jgi:hypothetical protein
MAHRIYNVAKGTLYDVHIPHTLCAIHTSLLTIQAPYGGLWWVLEPFSGSVSPSKRIKNLIRFFVQVSVQYSFPVCWRSKAHQRI